jgi:hypothetical protein
MSLLDRSVVNVVMIVRSVHNQITLLIYLSIRSTRMYTSNRLSKRTELHWMRCCSLLTSPNKRSPNLVTSLAL